MPVNLEKKAERQRRREREFREEHGISYWRLRRYGITPAQYHKMMRDQEGLCASCKEVPPDNIDHDHKTGKVRGLLCHHCNLGLAHFKDRPELLRRAIGYLSV